MRICKKNHFQPKNRTVFNPEIITEIFPSPQYGTIAGAEGEEISKIYTLINYKLNVFSNNRQSAADLTCFSASDLCEKSQENDLNASKRNIAIQIAFNGQLNFQFN